jgi:DnaK suppressor protein
LLSDADLAELEELICSHVEHLEALLDDREEASKPVQLDQQSIGRVSRIDAIQQQQMAVSNKKTAEKELISLRLALKKMTEDEYGYCESCGEDIGFKRLQIKPEAEFCISCQSGRE